MTLMLDLPPELESRLKNQARLHGLEVREYAKKLIEAGLPVDIELQKNLNRSTLDLLAQWDLKEATDDPKEMTQRARDAAELKEAMNQNRRESDGPDARIPFP